MCLDIIVLKYLTMFLLFVVFKQDLEFDGLPLNHFSVVCGLRVMTTSQVDAQFNLCVVLMAVWISRGTDFVFQIKRT